MQSNSRFQKLAIAAAATVAVGLVSWAAISSIRAADAPSGLAATAGDSQVTLTWNNPNDTTITGYQVLQVAIDKLVVPSTVTGAIEAGDRFGDSVGIAGNRAVVGAPLQESLDNQSVSITNGGWGHTFSRGSGGWSYDEFLAVSNPQVEGRLGSSVAVAGSTVMAGAPSYHQTNNTDPGEVTIASKSSLTGSLATEFTKTGQVGNDLFGRSVALDTGIAIVGAPAALIGSDALAGKAYLYTKDNSGVWGPAATAIWSAGTNARAGTVFGSSVAVDGNTVVIGSPGEDSYSGAAYVFTKTNNVWSAVRLTASDRANADSFGRWVAVDGDFVVVGAWQDDDGGTDSGSVYVFTKPSGGWGTWGGLSSTAKDALTAKLTASDAAADDHFGWSVAVDGDNVVVGAYGNDDDGTDSGSVYLFTKPSGGWVDATETVKLTAPDGAADDNFGDSVAAGGGRAIVGAPGDESDTGAAYVFSIPTWSNISNSDKDTTSHTVTGLDNDVEYTFLIRPVDSGGPGPASGSKHAKPQQAPAATPTNLTAAAGVGEVTLSWDDPNDSTITAYKYRQKEAGGSFGQWTTIPDSAYGEANTTGYTVSNLTNGQTYTFRIRAVDEDDDTANSNDVTVTTILAAPTNLTATVGVGAGQIALDWDNPNNTLITKYQYSTDGGTSFNDITGSSATTTEYTVTGLGNGTEYTLAVRAVNASVNGEAATVTATTRLPLVPLYVSNIGQPTDTSVGADADLSSDQAQQFSTGTDGAGYVLGSIDVYFQRGTDSEDLTVTVWNSNTNADPGSTVHTLTNPDTIEPGLVRFTAPAQLAANTNYFVHVAFSGSGTPPRLRTTTSTNEDAGAAANWSITNYRHQADTSSPTGWAYQFNLLKISINQVLDLPAAPANFEATGGDGQVVLSWDDPQDNYITKYQYSTDSGASYNNIALTAIDSSETGKFKYTVENLTNGTTHTFDVRAVNSAGNGEVSTETAVMMPAVPSNFSATPRDQRVELSWDDPGNTTITEYQLMQLAEESGLTADDGAKNDRFGVSVAVDDDTAVVGAFQPTYTDPDTSLDVSRPGAAYVYTKDSNGAWSQQAKLTASDGADGDEFGISVAVDGDTVVVGARGNVSKTGAIYVFTKLADDDWTATTTVAKLTATGGAADDLFGASVALYGDSTIVVGAPAAGSAYVFTKNSGVWSQAADLTATDAATGDEFGISVAVDDDTIAVGAYGKDGNSLTDPGLVYVFVKSGGAAWATTTETVQLRASDRDANDNFGRSVAVDTDTGTIVVGASGDRNTVGGTEVGTGSTYVFTEPNTGWANSGGTETAKLTASDGAHSDQFGRSVAVDGDTIVVGAHQNDDDGSDSGSIYVFIKPTNGWEDTTGTVKLTASDGKEGDRFGIALALDDDTALVAAPRNDANDDDDNAGNDVSDAGSAYVIGTSGWAKIPDTAAAIRSQTVTGLTNNIKHTFAMRAVNASGNGPASTASAMPAPLPDAPTGLSAKPGDRKVALTWDDPDDSTITKYQYSADGGANFSDFDGGSSASTTSYTITGLDNGVTYTLALRAVNPTGNGEASTVTALILPAKPTGLTGIEYNSQVELGWDDPDDSTITKYQLLQITPRKLTAGGAGRDGDFFGMAVAADGDTALVGALQAYDADFNNRPGAAYVFTKNSESGEWIQATLTALDGNNGDEFGRSVALDGDTAVVGAPGADKGVAGEGQVTGTGAAYVFIRDLAGSWTQAAKLTANDAAEDDQFAYSVAVYDDTVVIGAHQDDDDGAESGSAYVFTKPANGGWTSTNTAVKLTAPDAAAGGYYGNSVAVSGDTIVVGAHKADSAYAITKPSSDANDDGSIDWQDWDALDADGKAALTATLTAGNAAAGDEFGISVAIDGNTIVVGAHKADSAYAITKPSSDANNDGSIDWEDWDSLDADGKAALTATLTAFDATAGDEFGISVAVSGDTIVVGAHKDDDKGDESGSAYVFTKPAAGWDTTTETAKIIDQDGAEDDQFGSSLAVDGNTVLIGARGDGSNKGAAHIMGIPSWADISNSAPGEANATSYAVTGLTNDVVYTFRLRAVNRSGNGPASDRLNVTPKAVPYAPDNLLAAGGNGQVALSWDDPEDDTITGYKYSTDGGTTFAEIGGSGATTTTYTVTGLTNGVTHTLALRAVNDLGNGAPSTVSALMVPVAPANLSAAPGDGKVALSWADPGNATITKYQYSTDGDANFSDFDGGINSATTANTVTGLTNYQEYSFQIRAVNASGEGPASNSASATPRIGKPAKPTGLGAVAGDKQVTLRWTDPDDSTIDAYQISEVIPEDFLTASGGAAGAHFGTSVAIDGDTAVVGADRANSRRGSVHIFTRNASGKWTQQAKLEGENTGDQFGWSVAVEGDTVVVGAHAYDGEDDEDDTLTNSGAIYVFTKPTSGGGWADTIAAPAKLTPTVPEAYAFFGGSVALAGNTLAIGSRLYDAGGRLGAGAAYVFTKDSDSGVWTQAAKLTASTSLQLAYLGYSLAVDGDTVLVGAYGDDTVRGELGSGSAYVFEKPSEGWTDGNETAKLTASDRQPSGYFGFSVALDGDTAVIGASQHSDPEIGAGSGAAYVFARESGVWGEKARLTPSDAAARDNFGVSVAVDGDTVVVGSWQDDDNGRNSGSAYVFTKPDLGWAGTFETLKLTSPDGAVNDRFGWSVAVDEYAEGGGLALVGAYSDDIATGMDTGSVHVLGIPDWVDIDGSDDATISHNVTKELDYPETDLSNGTPYDFQIRAMNESGYGPASDGVSVTPLGVPAAPSLSAAAGDGQVTLSWTKHVPTDPITIGPITRYEYSTNGGSTFTEIDDSDIDDSDADNLAYTVTGLTNLTDYNFQILAVNVIGETPSDTVSATPTNVAPGEPQNLTATPGDTQVRLIWDDPNDSSIDKYEYRWKVGTAETDFGDEDVWYQIPESDAATIRYTVTGLSNGTSYAFQIHAVDNGEAGAAATATATPTGVDTNNVPIPPSKPSGFTAARGHRHVTLTWDDPDDSSIDKYQYQYLSENADGTFTAWGADWPDIPDSAPGENNETAYTVSGLTNGVNYKFRIRAVDLVDEGTDDDEFSAESNEAEATPLPDKPGAPTNLTVTEQNQQVTLNWRAPTNSLVDIYEVLHFQVTELTASNVVDDDKFGYSVAADGDIAVLGAYRDDADKSNGIVDSGAAYVFTRSTGVVWDRGVKLTASDGDSFDHFGISVAVDSETVVIGASGDDDNGADSGSVYVFTRDPDSGVWSQAAKLTASDGEALDYFGHSVAVSGNTVLVGAYQDDREETDTETELEDSGSVYVFTKPTGGWGAWDDLPQTGASDQEEDKDGLTAKLNAPNAADDDRFGTSVALDGDKAVIGVPGADDNNNGVDSGSAYVFAKPTEGWGAWDDLPQTADDEEDEDKDSLTTKLIASDGAAGDNFGHSVAVDVETEEVDGFEVEVTTVVVGAYRHDPVGPDSDPNAPSYLLDAGAAYVFTRDSGGVWDTGEKLTAEDGETGDYFGYSVAVDVDTVVVGASQDDDNGTDSGSAYIFTRDSGTNTWSQNNKLTHENGEAGDWFGYSVAVDTEAHTALIGAGSAHVMDIHDWHEVAVSGQVVTHTIADLTNNREYDFAVRAVNLAGTGEPAEMEATPVHTVYTPPPNVLPRFEEGTRTTRAVPENAETGTPVGEPVTATDQDNDPLEYSLSGTGQVSFDVDRRTGQITTRTLLDYEVESEYWVQLRVSDGEGGIDSIEVSIDVSNVDEAGTVSVSLEQPEVGTPVAVSLSDLDGSLSDISWQWARSSDRSDWSDISGANSDSYTPVADDVGIYLQATASYTDGHGPGKSAHAVMERQTAQPAATNRAPYFIIGSDTVTLTVDENTPPGSLVGDAITAKDPDGDVLTYSLSRTDASPFVLDGSTGQITVGSGTLLDYESGPTRYTVVVSVHDGRDAYGDDDTAVDASIEVSIDVSNVDEAGTVSVSPEQPEVGTALVASLSDLDGLVSDISWQWARSSDRSDWSDISGANSDSYTPVADDVGIYLQATASYTDGHGAGKSAHAVMERQTAQRGPSFNPGGHGPGQTAQPAATNRAPYFIIGSDTVTLTVDENTPPGSLVGDAVTAKDPDGDVLTYSLSGTDASSFVLDGSTGEITIGSGTLLDYESGPTRYTVVVSVHDGRDAYGDDDTAVDDLIEVSIDVSNVDEAGTVSVSPEQPEVGTALVASLSDPDGLVSNISWQWARSSDGSDWSDISGANSDSYTPVADDVGIYLQATASYTDGHGAGKSAHAVMERQTAQRGPSFEGDVTLTVDENTPPGSLVGDAITAKDPDGDVLTYSLSGTDASSFVLDGSTGEITVGSGTLLDYESGPTRYTVVVSVHDGRDAYGDDDTAVDDLIEVSIDVSNVDEAGTVSVSLEQPEVGTALVASLSDPDGLVSDISWQWARSSDRTDWSDISGANSDSYTPVADDVGIYLQATASYTDGHGAGKSAHAVMERQTAQRGPSFEGDVTLTVDENTPSGSLVGDAITATDPDGDILTYSLSGTDASSFVLDGSTGEITIGSGTLLDYESGPTRYTVVVSVHDGRGAYGDDDTAVDDLIEVSIDVSNVDEAGTVSVSLEQPEVGTALVASLSDPDGLVSDISWQWARSSDRTDWSDISGANSDSYTPVADDVGIYLQATASYTDGHGAGKSAHAVMERQTAQRGPSFEGDVTLTVDENTPSGSLVGDAITATDPDGDILTYSLSGTDASSFVLDDSTGEITIGSGTLLDYESGPTRYTVVVSVHDGRGAYGNDDTAVDDLIEVSIDVSNVDEAGTVSVSLEQPEVGTALVVSLSDPDGLVSDISWQWARSSDRTDWQDMAGASSFTYTPVDLDADKYLRVTASYSDGEGFGKQAQTVLNNPVQGLPEPVATPTTTATDTPALEPTPTPTLTAPTPTAEPAPSEADGGDEGFPWWVIVAVVIGVLGGIVLIVALRRRRR